ncbi:hypothetical protein LXA43DRAFT_1103897 [Ganoderma leucocontextum]|nr:hypothetical protein LXA43DRAFT_1103897 [Ganoderma leucocontextum]
MEQYSVHITIHPENTFLLEAIGPNAVYLSGNYVDEFANMRSIRDALKQTIMESVGGTRNLEHLGSRPANPDDTEPLGSITSNSPPNPNADKGRKRRRTTPEELFTPKGAPIQAGKGKEVDGAASSIPRIQWIDSGKPGTGDQTVAMGDEVSLKFKLKNSKGQLVSDNIQGGFLRFMVGDLSARVPHGFHVGLVGMKVGAQRIIMVPLDLALCEPNLVQFINPPQAYRIECFLADFTGPTAPGPVTP